MVSRFPKQTSTEPTRPLYQSTLQFKINSLLSEKSFFGHISIRNDSAYRLFCKQSLLIGRLHLTEKSRPSFAWEFFYWFEVFPYPVLGFKTILKTKMAAINDETYIYVQYVLQSSCCEKARQCRYCEAAKKLAGFMKILGIEIDYTKINSKNSVSTKNCLLQIFVSVCCTLKYIIYITIPTDA